MRFCFFVRVLWIASCACLLTPLQAAQDDAMLQADRAFTQAVAKRDRTALEKLLDPDFSWTDFNGKIRTRSEVLAGIPEPAISLDGHAQSKSFAYGRLGDVQENLDRAHVVRVWAKRSDGWKAIVHQEIMSLPAPPSVTPSAGKDCENPCKGIPFQPKTQTEREVAAAYSKLETAAMAHNSANFTIMAADEFIAVSSNSNKIYDKPGRLEDFAHSKMGGVAPTPLTAVRMFDFGDAVLMVSEHTPDRGKPLHVTRIWVKRNGNWVEAISYQTAVQALASR